MSSVKPEQGIREWLSQFINEWPLYGPSEVQFTQPVANAPEMPETILRECSGCTSTTTWRLTLPDTYSQGKYRIRTDVGTVITYMCSHCRANKVWLWIGTEDVLDPIDDGDIVGVKYFKWGQYPAQTINPPKKVEKSLDEPTLDLYKKGLTSFSHGYGLGAVSYFRRVVENATGVLIDELIERASEDNDSVTVEKLTQAKEGRVADEKLKLAADALPADLRPGRANPLATLYEQYSRGIHGLSDDQCLKVAHQLRFALDYTFENWLKEIDEAKRFRAEVQSWNDPTSKPEASGP